MPAVATNRIGEFAIDQVFGALIEMQQRLHTLQHVAEAGQAESLEDRKPLYAMARELRRFQDRVAVLEQMHGSLDAMGEWQARPGQAAQVRASIAHVAASIEALLAKVGYAPPMDHPPEAWEELLQEARELKAAAISAQTQREVAQRGYRTYAVKESGASVGQHGAPATDPWTSILQGLALLNTFIRMKFGKRD
ncbi:MAG: hypothetical protein MUF21_08995 [Gemmatimonadaceae bacterium]|jgi:hypothetical protein|nr:hypothetical protein [Gemmatimonadaceae bacterium]